MYHTSYINSYSGGILEKRAIPNPSKIQVVKRPTGYNANFRPCVYYTPQLDDLDNPQLKLKVSEHYATSNETDFKPYTISPIGKEMSLKQSDILPSASGFTTMRKRAYIHKTATQIEDSYKTSHQFLNQAVNGKAVNTQRNTKDPIANENNFTGPAPMSTENTSRYKGQQGRWPSQSWRFYKSVGQKEPTANTRVEPFDPIEYNTKNPYRNDIHQSNYHNKSNRPTGVSEQESHFQQHRFHSPIGKESDFYSAGTASGIPEPTPKSNRDTGYTLAGCCVPRYTDRDVPQSRSAQFYDDTYLSPTRSDAYKCTLARYSFTAPGIPNNQVDDRIGKRHIGQREATGYVKNHPSYKRVDDFNKAQRFQTHYENVFTLEKGENKKKMIKNTTLSLSSTGWPVAAKAENGFTKSTKVHSH